MAKLDQECKSSNGKKTKTNEQKQHVIIDPDLVYLPEWTFDRKRKIKRISANPNLTLKHKNIFGKTKWRHFLGKCPDTCSTNRSIFVKPYSLVETMVHKHPENIFKIRIQL